MLTDPYSGIEVRPEYQLRQLVTLHLAHPPVEAVTMQTGRFHHVEHDSLQDAGR